MGGNLAETSEVLPGIGDRSLRPNVRWRLMSGLVSGYCTNAREILFGVSPQRRLALDSAARLAADIVRTPEWHRLMREELDGWIDGPVATARLFERGDDPGTLARVAGFFGLGGLRARMRYCGRRFF